MPLFYLHMTHACNRFLQRVFRATTMMTVIKNVVNVLEMTFVTIIPVIVLESVLGIGRNPNVMVSNDKIFNVLKYMFFTSLFPSRVISETE